MEKFIVEISARHIHVTKEQVAILFGEGHTLTAKKALSQPGQFACEEKLTIVGPRGELKASILGPERKEAQVELSLTDARTLGVEAKIRESGDIEDFLYFLGRILNNHATLLGHNFLAG